jgi:hypothetical protein
LELLEYNLNCSGEKERREGGREGGRKEIPEIYTKIMKDIHCGS